MKFWPAHPAAFGGDIGGVPGRRTNVDIRPRLHIVGGPGAGPGTESKGNGIRF